MSGIKEVVLVGPGYMGGWTLEAWKQVSDRAHVGYIIDKDSSGKRTLAEELGAEFIVAPNPTDDVFQSAFKQRIAELSGQTDIWSISTPTSMHYAFLRLALELGVDKVFLEKPSTDSTDKTASILENYPNAIIQVDYGEVAHPVVVSISKAIEQSGFRPKHSFNWHARDTRHIPWDRINSGDETRITVADLIHEMSKVDVLMRAANGVGLADETLKLSDINLTSWGERYQNQDYSSWVADVASDFTINFSNGVSARILGEADFDSRRYFVLWNEDMAFFGQTLKRDHLDISPIAGQITGPNNVQRLLDIVYGGDLVYNSDFRKMFTAVNAREIDIIGYEIFPVRTLVKDLLDANSTYDLMCPLSSALGVEHLLERVYSESGRQELYRTPVVVTPNTNLSA